MAYGTFIIEFPKKKFGSSSSQHTIISHSMISRPRPLYQPRGAHLKIGRLTLRSRPILGSLSSLLFLPNLGFYPRTPSFSFCLPLPPPQRGREASSSIPLFFLFPGREVISWRGREEGGWNGRGGRGTQQSQNLPHRVDISTRIPQCRCRCRQEHDCDAPSLTGAPLHPVAPRGTTDD